jgi:hypothetical protein
MDGVTEAMVGFWLIGKPLDCDYRVCLKWNGIDNHYELINLASLAPVNFHRDPVSAPVLSSGTKDTPLFVINSCAIKRE